MKERKTNKGVVKRVILKTIGMTLLTNIAVIILFSICIFLLGGPMEVMKFICVLILLADIFPICLYVREFIEKEKEKSKEETD